MRSLHELVGEADEVLVDGWDFSWLEGRVTEERVGVRTLAGEPVEASRATVDLQTGGGKELAERVTIHL